MPDFAFLRSVNLGKHNKVPMKDLVALISERGWGPVSYLLASGNLVFPQGAPADVRAGLKELIRNEFDVDTDVIMRTGAELGKLLENNPYGVPKEGSVQIAIWDGAADSDGLCGLLEADHHPDRLHQADNALIIRYAGTSHDSKLNNNLVSRRLKVASTLRNVKTFIRLLERERL